MRFYYHYLTRIVFFVKFRGLNPILNYGFTSIGFKYTNSRVFIPQDEKWGSLVALISNNKS